MRIGCILTGYGMADYVQSCLAAWIAARQQRLDDHEFVICAVSVPFAAFPNTQDDGTVARLAAHLAAGEIDHLITEPKGIPETEARGAALSWLKTQDVDAVWQVDVDEIYTERDISRILRYVEANPFVMAFKGSLKNYVFDDKTYLVEPFTPMRIHRTGSLRYLADHFWDDNNIAYRDLRTDTIVRDVDMATLVIPASVGWPRHLTWQNSLRSKAKVEYQQSRGWSCSFRWDEATGLTWNEPYFRANNISYPPATRRD